MKLTYKMLVISFASLFLSSCVSDSSTPDQESIKDDFNYLSVNFSGQINEIGNNSGKITFYAQIQGLKTNTIFMNTVVSNSEKIILCEHYPTDELFSYDIMAKKTTSKKLVYPSEIVGEEPFLASLVWDQSKNILYGIVGDNLMASFNTKCYFVKIDPNTFEVSYTGLTFDQKASTAVLLNGNKLYSSYLNLNTYEIDIEKNTAKKVLFNNSDFSFTKAALHTNNIAYCLKSKTVNGATITKINLADNTFEDFFSNESLGIGTPNSVGYIDKSTNEYICYMLKNGRYVLVKFNLSTNTYKDLELTSSSSIDNNLVIVGKINN